MDDATLIMVILGLLMLFFGWVFKLGIETLRNSRKNARNKVSKRPKDLYAGIRSSGPIPVKPVNRKVTPSRTNSYKSESDSGTIFGSSLSAYMLLQEMQGKREEEEDKPVEGQGGEFGGGGASGSWDDEDLVKEESSNDAEYMNDNTSVKSNVISSVSAAAVADEPEPYHEPVLHDEPIKSYFDSDRSTGGCLGSPFSSSSGSPFSSGGCSGGGCSSDDSSYSSSFDD